MWFVGSGTEQVNAYKEAGAQNVVAGGGDAPESIQYPRFTIITVRTLPIKERCPRVCAEAQQILCPAER